MKTIQRGLLIALLILPFFYVVKAHAGSNISNVTIEKLHINKSIGEVLFIVTSSDQSKVGCHTDNNWNYVMPLTSELDKTLYSALLAAYVSQSKVQIIGTGECGSAFANIESLDKFYIYQQ